MKRTHHKIIRKKNQKLFSALIPLEMDFFHPFSFLLLSSDRWSLWCLLVKAIRLIQNFHGGYQRRIQWKISQVLHTLFHRWTNWERLKVCQFQCPSIWTHSHIHFLLDWSKTTDFVVLWHTKSLKKSLKLKLNSNLKLTNVPMNFSYSINEQTQAKSAQTLSYFPTFRNMICLRSNIWRIKFQLQIHSQKHLFCTVFRLVALHFV